MLVSLRHVPLIINPSTSPQWKECMELAPWMGRHRQDVWRSLDTHGAVLFRGFRASETAYDFSDAMKALGLDSFDASESAAPRTSVAPFVFTANEAPETEVIPFHHEMAQCESPPDVIAFFCEVPPQSKGATPFVSSVQVASFVEWLLPESVKELSERRIRYARTLPAQSDTGSPIGRSWRDTYGPTKDDVEAALSGKGEWTWLENDDLRILSPPRQMFSTDRRGRPTFFNSAVAARKGWKDVRNDPEKSIVYADTCEPLNTEAKMLLDAASHYMDANAVRVQWQAGDLLLLDNQQMLHARDPFTPPRRILASLWGPPLS